MRALLISLLLAAQQWQSPNPDVGAADASWQINNEPIVVGGLTYYPTRVRTYERGPDGERWFISGRGRPDIGTLGIAGVVGTAGDIFETDAPVAFEAPIVTSVPAGLESIRVPRRNSGVWVEFNGTRW